jgi:CubicO group peptidase (beta-lactamase class C family)
MPADIATWERVQTYEGLMALMARQSFRLLGPPGAMLNYSNEGYVLLAAIVERASGQTFPEYLQQHILGPLKLMRTGLYTRETPPQEPEVIPFAVGVKDGKREVFGSPAWWDQGTMYGNGGLKSTVQDLLRYLEVYRTGGKADGTRVLSPDGVAQMTTPHMPNPLGGGYGYGLRIADAPGIGRTVGHSGGNKGVATQVVALPEQGVTAVALTNLANAPATPLASGLVNAFLGQAPEAPWAIYPHHKLDRKQLSRFVGVYQGQPGTTIRVAERDGALWVALADELQRARPYADTGFVVEATGEPLCFLTRPAADGREVVWALFSGLRTMPLALPAM